MSYSCRTIQVGSPQTLDFIGLFYPMTSSSGKSGCPLIHLSNVLQMLIFRAFSYFVIPRKSTFFYYFLYRLVQNWYKIGTKIIASSISFCQLYTFNTVYYSFPISFMQIYRIQFTFLVFIDSSFCLLT